MVKLLTRFSIKILTQIFNFLLKFSFFKKILLSKKIKKSIFFILNLLPDKIKFKIIANINKKVEKVLKIDLTSS